jgi:hypothetical protein
MVLPEKNYYRVSELAAAWGCSVEDIFHHFLHDHLRLGIHVFNKILYGLNADFRTVGIYSVIGVITIPPVCAETWEMGSEEVSQAGGFLVEPDYPPLITEASYLEEASFAPPMFPWAAGRDWEHPETDHSLIKRFMVGRNDLYLIKKSDVVVHAVERARLEGEPLKIGSPEWRSQIARKAANARHDQPGGSRDKQQQIREIWASGKYSSRDICAEQECAALDMSFTAARKALRNTPEPSGRREKP